MRRTEEKAIALIQARAGGREQLRRKTYFRTQEVKLENLVTTKCTSVKPCHFGSLWTAQAFLSSPFNSPRKVLSIPAVQADTCSRIYPTVWGKRLDKNLKQIRIPTPALESVLLAFLSSTRTHHVLTYQPAPHTLQNMPKACKVALHFLMKVGLFGQLDSENI